MRQAVLKAVIATSFFAASSFAIAQQKLDIVQIMGQFVQASYAASKCSKPDQKTLSSFLSNFKIVSVRATEEMKKRNPGLSDQQIVEGFKKQTTAVEKAIDGAIGTNGCGDPRIQDLLKRFEVQANLKL
jgi:hypothetical protein